MCDFEYHPEHGVEGDPPRPVCMVVREYVSGQTFRYWQDELVKLTAAPFPVGPNALFVAYYASAEIGCFLRLGWPVPARVLDLFTAFRIHTNGNNLPYGSGLVGALAYFGLPSLATGEKDAHRDLILTGGPWSPDEQARILDYCASDVDGLTKLFPALAPHIDWTRIGIHGSYSVAAAHIEDTGIPIDLPALRRLRDGWGKIQKKVISDVDTQYGVYDGLSFKQDRFENYLARAGIPWPRTATGRLDLQDDTFRSMARSYPQLSPLREVRTTLSKLRLSDLTVGMDGRNRCLLSIYRSRTGRNQPSNAKFIFGPSTWLRGLIQPSPGRGLAYVDWSQQEFGIAAALSGDVNMAAAYRSGDPYLAFAIQAGAVPNAATKSTHGTEREQFKQCVLATQYGMEAESLALRINQPVARARQLLRMHRSTYPVFWSWSDRVVNHALLGGRLWTVFGWRILVGGDANVRSLRNFPMQANGAEMLRLACVRLIQDGIRICAPVHDAILIEAPLEELDEAVAQTQSAMRWASSVVLGGFELNSDAKVVRWPDRYMDPRGVEMWNTVMGALSLNDRIVARR